MNNRRRIILFAAPALALGLAGTRAGAQAKVTESDPTAMALGYREDASKVDTGKYKQYVKGSTCSNCNFYGGKATDATAPCSVLGNRLVVGKGWCSAWVKKA
jgi:hypothetical protein